MEINQNNTQFTYAQKKLNPGFKLGFLLLNDFAEVAHKTGFCIFEKNIKS